MAKRTSALAPLASGWVASRWAKRTATVGLALGLSACQVDSDLGPAGPSGPRIRCGDEMVLGTAPVRRLSNTEHERTLAVLFPELAAAGFLETLPEQPPDEVTEGGYENDALALGPSDVRIARGADGAFAIAAAAVADPAVRARIAPCGLEPSGTEATDCMRAFLTRFGRDALRRPLTPEELTRYELYFESQRAAIDFEAAIELSIATFLQSPQFQYRLEFGASVAAGAEAAPLDGYELASRLSYLLWQSMPDEALFIAAENGTLLDPATLETEVRRMLADPRALDTLVDFHRQWLALDRVLNDADGRLPDLYPSWNAELQASMAEESLRFIRHVYGEGDGTVAELLTSNAAEVNGPLAELYGVEGSFGPGEWRDVSLPPSERAGILTRAAFLASRAHAANGSPPLRGNYLMTRILCEPPLSPPGDADTSPPMAMPGEGPMTNRDLFLRRVASPYCQSCHVRIDGFGFGFESYDAIGAHRMLDNGLPVDATGAVSGTDVDGEYTDAVELSGLLAGSRTVHRCVTRQVVRFSAGRALEAADACVVDRLSRAFIEDGGSVEDLLVRIATSPEMRHRPVVRPEEVSP